MKQLIQDMAQQIRRIAVAAEAFVAQGGGNGGSGMGNVSIYNGGCDGGLLASEVKHVAINIVLPDDLSLTGEEIILGVTGKYIAVLSGRIGSANKAHILIKAGQPPETLDQTYTPENSYILPPTTVNMPHYQTGIGAGLTIEAEALVEKGVDEPTRYVTGFLKYIEVEIL
jgi:hypothetical protein